MEMLIGLLGAVILVWIVFEVSTFIVYGPPTMSDDELLDTIERHKSNGTRLNDFSNSILYVGNLPYIGIVVTSLIFTHYISGVGVIPRWYKSSKVIKKMFDEKRLEKLKNL